MAQHLLERGVPAGTPGRIALPVAGDDPSAKAVVMELIEQIGFDPVDAGTIDDSWRQQPGHPGYVEDFDVKRWRETLSAPADGTPKRTDEWRATPESPGTFEAPR